MVTVVKMVWLVSAPVLAAPNVLEDDDSGEIRALAFGGENTPARVMTVNDARDRNSLAAFASLDLFLFFFSSLR